MTSESMPTDNKNPENSAVNPWEYEQNMPVISNPVEAQQTETTPTIPTAPNQGHESASEEYGFNPGQLSEAGFTDDEGL